MADRRRGQPQSLGSVPDMPLLEHDMKEHEQIDIDPCQMRGVQHAAENIPLDSPAATVDHLASPTIQSGERNMAEPLDAASLDMNASLTTRRAALAALAAPLAAQSAVNTDGIAEVIALAAEKNAAFIRGDMERWSKLVRIAPDFTLIQPFGGPASHGFDASAQRLAEMSRYFARARPSWKIAQAVSSGEWSSWS